MKGRTIRAGKKIEQQKRTIYLSGLEVGGFYVSRTIFRDINHCLPGRFADETEQAIFAIKLLETGFIKVDRELTAKYGVTVYKILKKWTTISLLDNIKTVK